MFSRHFAKEDRLLSSLGSASEQDPNGLEGNKSASQKHIVAGQALGKALAAVEMEC